MRDFARKAGRKANQAIMVFFKQGVVDSRLVVKALGKAERYKLDYILIACVVLAEQHHMIVALKLAFFKA